jgi:hypothetical protein
MLTYADAAEALLLRCGAGREAGGGGGGGRVRK